MGVFVGGDPADRGFMHADVFGHITKNEWFKMAWTMFKKIPLKFQAGFPSLYKWFAAVAGWI